MYHYVESGLDNIWLRNGYVEEDTAYGPTVAFKDILEQRRLSPLLPTSCCA